MLKLPKRLEANSETKKTFSYKIGDISLNFVLIVDTKESLRDFKTLLTKALEDVEEELSK